MIICAWACCTAFNLATYAADPAPGTAGKKLIEYGWDVPTPDFVATHIRDMEKRPFDGLIFKLNGGGSVFDPKPWDAAKFAKDFNVLPTIQWKKFTDNFVIMWSASDQDWFNDTQWANIESHATLMARAAKAAHCVGLCFDAEPYGTDPWSYTDAPHHATKGFAEYEAVVRKRGAQFIRAIQKEMPQPKLLTFFMDSLFLDLCRPMPKDLREQRLSLEHYALYPAFLEGIIEGAAPGAEIIDGNENSYYYTKSREYLDEYHGVTQRARYLVGSKCWPAYRDKVRAGQALYIDQYFGLRKERVLGNYMTPDQRPKWFEHNAYWALYTADTYVWCYSERMNWWKNQDIPQGAEEALRAARAAIDAGRQLSFQLAPIVKAAQVREIADPQKHLVRRQADVRYLPQGVASPVLDGFLTDAAWKNATLIKSFVPVFNRATPVTAGTDGHISYDDKAIYIALTCHEPNPAGMRCNAPAGSESIFSGDVVEVFISLPGAKRRVLHLAVNPKDAVWAGIHEGATIAPLHAPWRHAARIGKDAWTVEIAIPWSTVGVSAPSPGFRLRANLGRERFQGKELSTWRSVERGFLEPQNFGAWVFD